MKTHLFLIVLCLIKFPLFAQDSIARIAPGAETRLAELLNKPAMVSPATAVPLGRNWFTLEGDTHVFTDQASFNQVIATLLDFENHDSIFNGTRNRRQLQIVSRTGDEIIADMVSITVAPLGIQIRSAYRVSMRTIEKTDTRFIFELKQLPQDSDSNRDIKNHTAIRYVQEVTIDGKNYTYIRIFSRNDVNAGVLPNARNTFERNAAPANEENLQLIINAAEGR